MWVCYNKGTTGEQPQENKGVLKMKIRFESKTIEVSKAFLNRASQFDSAEYTALRTVTKELPEFAIVVKLAPRPRQTYQSPTYNQMESYISMMDENGSDLELFRSLRQECNYTMVTRWFIDRFPEFYNLPAA